MRARQFGTSVATDRAPSRFSPLASLLGEAELKLLRSCLAGLALAGTFTTTTALAVPISDQMTLYSPENQPLYQVTLYEDGSSLFGLSGTPSTVPYCSDALFSGYCVFPVNIGNASLALNGGTSPTALFISEGSSNKLSDIVFVYNVVVGDTTQHWVLFESDAEGQNIPWGPDIPGVP